MPYELKTQKSDASATKFIDSLEDEQRRTDCHTLLKLMQKITKDEGKRWGANIVGFGSYDYTYASGHSGTWFQCGFSPRKQAISLHISCCDVKAHGDLLKKLGKIKHGKSCIYVKKLEDIDLKVLEKIIRKSIMKKSHKNQ